MLGKLQEVMIKALHLYVKGEEVKVDESILKEIKDDIPEE